MHELKPPLACEDMPLGHTFPYLLYFLLSVSVTPELGEEEWHFKQLLWRTLPCSPLLPSHFLSYARGDAFIIRPQNLTCECGRKAGAES